MGRPSNLEARRAQVADALVRLLATGSFSDISVAELAREAALAPGLVHHYFRDKEEVLVVAVERLAMGLELRLVEQLKTAGEVGKARVHAFIDAWLSPEAGANPRAAFAWVAIGDEARRRPEVRRIYVAAFERAVERLVDEVKHWLSPVRRQRAGKIARAVMVAIEGALRVGAAGGLEAGMAAPLVRGLADALVNEAASPADLSDPPPRRR